ncbi:MAG: histidine phosphatase family protein [Candidatus Rokubacteria bacterium]|nr:histidine phosphatase family protein [Candidatus Rokubacteria bacterium]
MTAATLVLLVRHGLTPTTGRKLPGRAPGLHLAEAGRGQAEAAGARIARLGGVAAVYSSPLERARETAAAIAQACHVPARVEPGLNEVQIGRWTGLSIARVRRKREWRSVLRHPSGFRFPDGESFPEMQARVVAALERLCERHPGETVVAVSHGDPIKAAVAHALGVPLDLFNRIVIAPASVTAIAFRSEGPVVLTVNSSDGELAGLAG